MSKPAYDSHSEDGAAGNSDDDDGAYDDDEFEREHDEDNDSMQDASPGGGIDITAQNGV